MPSAIRRALRLLRTAPGFAAAAALTLALGIGLAAAMGTVARAVAFADFPVRDQDRVVVLWGEQPSIDHLPLDLRQFEEFAEGARGLEAVAATDYNGGWPRFFDLGASAGAPVRLRQVVVSGNLFQVLGSRPLLGRTLRPEDDVVGGPVVAVLSHATWRRHFNSDPGVLGRSVRSAQDPRPHTIVGVMPPGLDFPRGADLWTPLRPSWAQNGRLDSTFIALDVVARLAPGTAPAQAGAALTAFYGLDLGKRGRPPGEAHGTARTLADAVVGDARRAFGATAAAAGLVLLIACVNVAGLVLVRAERRRRELAVRAAVGAGRGRIVVQLLAEHGALAAAGGLLGALLAAGLVRAFAALAPADLPRVAEVRVDGALLGAAVLATAGVVLLVGLLPALGAAGRVDVGEVLRADARGAVGGHRARRGRRALVGAQVALAVVVLAAAGLLGRSFARLRAVDLGVAADRLALVQLIPPPDQMETLGAQGTDRWRDALDAMLARVGALPGVTGVAPVGAAPFSGTGGWDIRAEVEGVAFGDSARAPWLNMEVTTAGYARAAGVPLLRGRFLADADREGAPGAVVLSERAARAMWPGEDAVGKRLRFGPRDPAGWRTVVGVVGETRWRDLVAPRPGIYIPYRQFPPSPTYLLVRTAGDPALVLPAVRRAVDEVAPGVTVAAGNTFRELTAAPLARPRLLSAMLGAFALVAAALTAVGLFGVVAGAVAERRRELGVRSALGARPGDLRGLVLGEGMRVAAVGVAIGLVVALAGGQLLRTLLYDVGAADPLALGGSALALLAVCAAACLVPALRAARADPAAVLRAD